MGRVGAIAVGLLLLVAVLLSSETAGADVQPKVVGGGSASIAQFPWQAAVVFTPAKMPGKNAYQRLWCGGSLITTRIVITAGHCVSGHSASDFDVVLGRTTLSNSAEGSEVAVQALTNQAHYMGSSAPRYDVGYLVLASPSAQSTIQVAGGTEGGLWSPGAVEAISGWGCTSPPSSLPILGGGCNPSDTLQAAQVPIVSDGTCSADYGSLFDPSTQVCAGYPNGGVDSCNGDSGGPLEAPIGGGAYRLVGMTSWGDGCAQAGKPGVYARVAGSALRPLIGADVCALETQNGLTHEQVIAGATSADDPCLPPPPASSATTHRKKCKRIQNKVKRHRCFKKAKRKAKQTS
jgi:trypsin